MPIHDWTRVAAGTFHTFHLRWIAALCDWFNGGGLPEGYFAMAEAITGGYEPDVVALELSPRTGESESPGGTAVATRAPTATIMARTERARYAAKANRIVIRHRDGEVVAVVEIVSPGNKDSRDAMKQFTRKAATFLAHGIHLLVIDLFPPNKRNPEGIHKAIWDRIRDEDYSQPADKLLTVVSYAAADEIVAYIEPLKVGDLLPEVPVFIAADRYVNCPLENTYEATWNVFPKALKGPLELPPA